MAMQVGGYEAFIPTPLPPPDLEVDERTLTLLSKADRELGRLDAATAIVPDPDLFVFMYVRREAVLSSQIEGTQASLMDILEYEALRGNAEERVDVHEIANCISAMSLGLRRLEDLPISRRLMCEVHAELMKDVRGGESQKTPGAFRTSQNWIGGASPATARFVPPPADEVGPAFADLERYLHDPSPVAPLVRIGLVHAQFETIHPFLDGNGRTGRLLITFWLVEQRILRGPLLYPSLYFKEHRNEYIDRLQAIRDRGEWEAWLAYFIEGIGLVAREAADRALEIARMREQDRGVITERLGRRVPNALALLDELFRLPVVNAKRVEELVEVSQPTASALVNDLARIGILKEITGRRRDRLFVYDRYMSLFPGAADRG
jgi:Fic family protein